MFVVPYGCGNGVLTIVKGTASGKSSSSYEMSMRRTIVANAKVASNIAK